MKYHKKILRVDIKRIKYYTSNFGNFPPKK